MNCKRITNFLYRRLKPIALARAPDAVIGGDETPYMLRWWVIPRNRWFNIYLHHFRRSDDDRALHDHPWWNCSILLDGEYDEVTPKGTKRRRTGQIALRSAKAAHRIQLLYDYAAETNLAFLHPRIKEDWHRARPERPVWTLFITGPRIREWGFHCPRGWRPWQEFTNPADGGKTVGKGCD